MTEREKALLEFARRQVVALGMRDKVPLLKRSALRWTHDIHHRPNFVRRLPKVGER